MRDSRPKLLKLVALKRQKAEQSLAIVQAELRDLGKQLDALQEEFASADRAGGDVRAMMLSSQYGHSRRVLHDMDRKRSEIADAQQRFNAAREELKRILNSEDQLIQMGAGS